MTDEELAAIRALVNVEPIVCEDIDKRGMPRGKWIIRYRDEYPYSITGYRVSALTLLSEVERLRAENAAMREIVAEVAALSSVGNDLCFCYHHDETRNFAGQTAEWIEMGQPHKPECIYTKAHALIDSTSSAGTRTESDSAQ